MWCARGWTIVHLNTSGWLSLFLWEKFTWFDSLLKYYKAIISLSNLTIIFSLTWFWETSVFNGCKQPFLGTVAIKLVWKLLDNDEKKYIISQRTAVRLALLMPVEGPFLPQKFPCNLSWLKTYYLLFKNTGKLVRRVSKISWRVRRIICGWHVMIVKCISFWVLF